MKRPLWLWLLLAGFVILAAAYSVVVPLGEAPDEVSHWAYVQYLVTQRALPKPEGAVLGESHQPPLYYLLGALVTAWIPQSEFAPIANPDFAFDQAQTPNLLLHTRREQLPYRDTPLAWHLWRLLSVAMGAVTVWATYKTCEVLGWPSLGLAAAAFVAFLPAFTFLSSVVNNDNLVIMLSALGVLQTLRVTRGRACGRDLFLLGLILGLAALTKLSGLVLWLFTGALLVWQAWSQHKWRGFVRSAVWVLGIGVIIVLPWIIHNLSQYGDPLGWSLVMAATPGRHTAITWDDLRVLMWGLWTSFWGRFGGALHLRMAEALYAAVALLPALSIVGWLRGRRDKRDLGKLSLFALFWALMLAAFARWTLAVLGTDQARQLYPGLPLFAIVLMGGLARLFPRRPHLMPVTAASALVALDIAVLAYLSVTFAPPSVNADALPRLDGPSADFGGTIRVLGYDVDPVRAAPGDSVKVSVNWQALQDPAEDYWLLLQLKSTGEQVVNKDGVPGAGRATTDWWKKGQVFTSYHTLAIPNDLPPGTYALRLGLRPFGNWEWLPVNGLDMLPLGKVTVITGPE